MESAATLYTQEHEDRSRAFHSAKQGQGKT